MPSCADLVLPVVLSAIATWLLSAVSWMVLPFHRKDYARLPDEDAAMDAVRQQGLAPGQYAMPFCDHGNMKDPAVQAKMARGPNGIVTILPPGPPRMGKALTLWFGFALLAGAVVSGVARHGLIAGAPGGEVFCVTFTAFLGIHVVSQLPPSIWMGRPWRATLTQMLDGLLYSLAGAGLFAWLWPSAV
jgi:hypothetical protein